VTLTTVSCVSLLIAIAALATLITAAPPYAIGSVLALASLALLGAGARVSIMLAGLSPRLPAEPPTDDPEGASIDLSRRALRADRWLTSLLSAFAASAAVGAIVTVLAGAPRPSCLAFGALTGALLLMRSRGADLRRALVFVGAGMAVATTTFAVAAPGVSGPGIATATATLACGAMLVGFVAPRVPLSPVARRAVAVSESAALVAAVPLTCWICGLYGVVRGMSLA
jgi:type VII secretion integral membrane protein EccD